MTHSERGRCAFLKDRVEEGKTPLSSSQIFGGHLLSPLAVVPLKIPLEHRRERMEAAEPRARRRASP